MRPNNTNYRINEIQASEWKEEEATEEEIMDALFSIEDSELDEFLSDDEPSGTLATISKHDQVDELSFGAMNLCEVETSSEDLRQG